jgi:hypothetical protein
MKAILIGVIILKNPRISPNHIMNKPRKCIVRIKGILSPRWSEWFEGFNICHKSSETILTGTLPDQPALFGLLTKIRDLGIELISVEVLENNDGKMENVKIKNSGTR